MAYTWKQTWDFLNKVKSTWGTLKWIVSVLAGVIVLVSSFIQHIPFAYAFTAALIAVGAVLFIWERAIDIKSRRPLLSFNGVAFEPFREGCALKIGVSNISQIPAWNVRIQVGAAPVDQPELFKVYHDDITIGEICSGGEILSATVFFNENVNLWIVYRASYGQNEHDGAPYQTDRWNTYVCNPPVHYLMKATDRQKLSPYVKLKFESKGNGKSTRNVPWGKLGWRW